MTNILERQSATRLAGPHLALPVTVFFLLLWHVRTTGEMGAAAVLSTLALTALSFAFGRLFLLAMGRLSVQPLHAALQLLGGFFIFNTSLFLMALILPFGIVANVGILAAVCVGATALTWRRRALAQAPDGGAGAWLPCLLAFLVSGIAATIWCGDAQPSLVEAGNISYFKVWKDAFIHASEIKVFAQAHGIATIDDIKLAGAATPVYHFASYVPAAAMSALAGVPAFATFSSVQLPLGIFLTGIAAFALMASMFGGWAGLAACIAVLLLPDAHFQGVANRYMSYHFIGQVGPGMLYGVACAALGWLLMIDGCRRGKLALVLFSYALLLACLLYKAHVFVANAFLLMVYPCLFFKAIAGKWRLLVAACAIPLFGAVVMLSQRMPRVPVLRLDGSGIDDYEQYIVANFDGPGLVSHFFGRVILIANYPRPIELVYAAAMILVCTFGLWLLATPAVAYVSRSRISMQYLLFPFLIVLNYLVMAMGLAMDTRRIGNPEELLHRPLVWAYFVVAAWTAGAIYYLTFDQRPQRRNAGWAGLALLFIVGLVFASRTAPQLQTMPARLAYATYATATGTITCELRAAEFMRTHGHPNDIFADPEGDAKLRMTALSEKRLYVGTSEFGGALALQRSRMDELAALAALHDAAQVRAYAAQRGINWYVKWPRAAVAWDAALANAPDFDCGGVRVYHLAD